ncbi:hypothetical protein OROHE_019281 [Orobanche hederae]
MGVIDLFYQSSSCFVERRKHNISCNFEGKPRRDAITFMTPPASSASSAVPVKEECRKEGSCSLTGDSFIRPHLRKLSPYQPILPFEVLSTRLGRKPEEIIKLDANENPYGPPPEVFEALGSIKFPYIYPDPESRRLRAALAEDSGLEAEYILVGCGADELIDLVMRCVLEPGDKIVDCPPTFTMYEFDAAVNGALVIKKALRKCPSQENFEKYKEAKREAKKAVRESRAKINQELYTILNTKEGERDIYKIARIKDRRTRDIGRVKCVKDVDHNVLVGDQEIRERWRTYFDNLFYQREEDIGDVPRKPDFSLDVDRIVEIVKQEKPKCIFLTSPNNPDGSIIDDETLLKILKLPILVVLDEAYIEFAGLESKMRWVKKYENLIVLRTFSKRAALAGLRVGYGAFPLSIIKYIWRAKQPYNVSVAAEVAACAALENPAYLENVKVALVQERERLFNLLKQVPFLNPYPSYSNFILCEVTSGRDAKKLKEDLARIGVMIRHYSNKELVGYVRVSVGKPEHTDALMESLKRLY